MSNPAARAVATSLRVLPRKRISRLVGQLSRVEAPDSVLSMAMRVYCRAYDIDLADYEIPAEGFTSFDAFFTRKLKPGARPIDADPDVLVAPADGRVEDLGPIERGSTFLVKGRPYSVVELLGDEQATAEYEGGSFAIVYLSPRDYHRVHAPVTGPVTAIRHVPGTLYPVNSIGLSHVPNLFARNERVVVHQRSERHGRIASIMVGAIGVGRISLAFDESVLTNDDRESGLRVYGDRAPQLSRGDELGTFHLGSTVIVLIAPDQASRLCVERGATVRMGEPLARRGRAQ
jgi:phosphatidylserine decarboxylase